MSSRSPTKHENADLRLARACKDASGGIPINLDSSTPCWNGDRVVLLEVAVAPPPRIFEEDREVHEVREI